VLADRFTRRSIEPFSVPATPLTDDTRAVLAIAVKIGQTRLIDNTVLGEVDGTLD